MNALIIFIFSFLHLHLTFNIYFSPYLNSYLPTVSLSPAISVDIDLLSKTLEPNNISIEIHQDHQIGRKLLDESFFFLDSILNMSQSQFSSLSTLLNQRPYGQTFTFPAPDSKFSSLSNISRLNHLKVQFRRNFWHLKSYVKLIQSLA